MRRIVSMLTRLQPDIVFITGDLYDGGKVDPDQVTAPLKKLSTKFGAYFVTGNHEEFSDSTKYLDAIKGSGIGVLENDKVKVYETTYKPGDVNTGVATSATRIIRVMKGGTIERTYADGKKETLVLKTGEVNFYTQLPAYNVENIGKTVFQTYVVQLK